MLHILTIAVRQIMHAFAVAIKNSQNTNVQQDYQKSSEFGYYFRFPSFCFLEEKPLGFICAS